VISLYFYIKEYFWDIWRSSKVTMFRSSPGVEQLSADLQKKSRQIDMLESTIAKLNIDLEASKKQITDLKKVWFTWFHGDLL
jgi:predicted RNase H-like nuclease (RuvC/YqgF family)